jgi:hypothetical protein
MQKDFDMLLTTYTKARAIKAGCKVSQEQKSIIFDFIREFKKHADIGNATICNREGTLRHAKNYLTGYGYL